MKRLRVLVLPVLALWLMVGVPTGATAETLEESLVRQMQEQGYTSVSVTRTLLGRIMVVAKTPDVHREIVIHPVTGEILRDYVRDLRLARDESRRGGDGAVRASALEGRGVDLPDRPAVGVASDPSPGVGDVLE